MMSEKEKYTIKKIVKNCVFPEGLYVLKDKETKFYLILEDKADVEKLKHYLINKDQQIDQLKQQLAETEQKFLEFQEDSIRNEQTYVRELTEKQNTIDEINKEFVQAVHDWKTLCAEKDKNFQEYRNEVVSNIEKEVYERMRDTVKEYEMQLAEKDKEIERLKQELEETNAGYDYIYEQSTETIKELKQNQTQLAISELEKVKTLIQNAINFEKPNFVEVYDAINKQINDLRGEKDVKD